LDPAAGRAGLSKRPSTPGCSIFGSGGSAGGRQGWTRRQPRVSIGRDCALWPERM